MNRTHRTSLGLLLGLLLAGVIVSAPALAENLKKMPGYIDLSWIEIPDDAEVIQDIDLSTVLIGVAADAEEAGDKELATALSMIKSIRVKAFSTEHSSEGEIDSMIQEVRAQLKKNDWERLVYVKDDQETLTVNTKYRDGNMVGLMVVTHEAGEEVAFVNVVGDLDLATLMKLGLSMDELDLDELMDSLDQHESH